MKCLNCGLVELRLGQSKFCSRACLYQNLVGRASPLKGIPRTEEAKRNMKGKHLNQIPWSKGKTKETDERLLRTSEKISKAMVGNKNPLGSKRTDETKEKLRIANLGDKNPIHRPGAIEKMKISLKKYYETHDSPMGGKHHTEESKELMRQAALNMSQETRKKIGDISRGRKHTLGTKLKMSKSAIENMKKKASFWNHGPNKCEKIIDIFIKDNNLTYKFTGDGKFWVENMIPDWVNINGEKKVIEHNGCWFHGCSQCYPQGGYNGIKDDSQKRIENFKKYGFETLVIWEHELKTGNWKDKILEFSKGGM